MVDFRLSSEFSGGGGGRFLAAHRYTNKIIQGTSVFWMNSPLKNGGTFFKYITNQSQNTPLLRELMKNDGIFFIQDLREIKQQKHQKQKTHNSFWQQIGCYPIYWGSDLEPGMMYFPTKWGVKEPQNPQNHSVASCVEPKFCCFFHKQPSN